MTPAPGFFPFVKWRTVKPRSGVCVNHAKSSDTWIVIKEPCGNTGAVIFDEDSFIFQVSASVSLWEFPWVSVLECSSFFTNILLCKKKQCLDFFDWPLSNSFTVKFVAQSVVTRHAFPPHPPLLSLYHYPNLKPCDGPAARPGGGGIGEGPPTLTEPQHSLLTLLYIHDELRQMLHDIVSHSTKGWNTLYYYQLSN